MSRPTTILRAVFLGIASSGAACVVVWLSDIVPIKVHAWSLLALTTLFAISDAHFKSLLSELAALLRRGTYSSWQLEELNQTVPEMRKQVSLVWTVSTWLKALVGLAGALLLWDELPAQYRLLIMFTAYSCLFYSMALAFWGRVNFRKLEKAVDEICIKEAVLKEKRRLAQLETGDEHDFKKDELAGGYTKPPIAL